MIENIHCDLTEGPNLQNYFDLVTISFRLLRALKAGAIVK